MVEVTMLKPKYFCYILTVNIASQPKFFLSTILTCFLLILSHHRTITVAQNKITSIGVIINADSRIGKEVKTAMEMAVQNCSSNSMDRLFSLHFRNPGSNPLQAAYAAEELIHKEKVQVIISTGTWQEAVLVAEIGNQTEVPVLSLAVPVVAPPLAALQWPFLVQMASNVTEQMRCIAAISHFFQWRQVIAIYEVDRYGGDSGMFAVLAEQLQNASSEIEHRLILPPISSLHDPRQFVREELAKLKSKESRVFIILQSSLSMATHLFKEAKQMGLMSKDSAWIVTDIIASLLDSVDTSVISSMEGAIGIKTHFSEDTRSFMNFKAQFKKIFRSEYPEEENSEPGIHALKAFDSITTITKAMNRLDGNTESPSMLLTNILSSNFKGLSGRISFHSGVLWNSPVYSIINVIGKSYKEFGFWLSKFGFSKDIVTGESGEVHRRANNDGGDNMQSLADLVTWPGNLKSAPKSGWARPTDENKIKIGIPERTAFDIFMKVEDVNNSSMENYSGFCKDVFDEVLKLVEKKYPLPHEFHPYNGTYDDVVNCVYNKTFDAVIGDVTILANRSRHVEFTQPFIESSLTMIVTEKTEAEKSWMFLKPFTKGMWAATGAILIYTVFIVWLLERQSNPEFEGPWKTQLGTAFWFTYSSLFFAQRERVHNSYTRVVVFVWLFVVLALNSCYTASLSSILTVSKLKPNVDIEWLKRHNATIGCDGDTFMRKYLVDVLNFKDANIKNINHENDYPGELQSGSITAAFLELPYEKAFLMKYCKGFTGSELPDRFGGFGFVFQKGSPIADDFSEAILTLSENGVLTQLKNKWLTPSKECSTSQTTSTDSLSWRSFWGIYLFSAGISTICYILFFIHQFSKRYHKAYEGDSTTSDDNSSNNLVKFVSYFHKGKVKGSGGASRMAQAPEGDELSSISWENVTSSESLEKLETPTIADQNEMK